MAKNDGWYPKSFVWVGPQIMTKNGLELHSVVAEDQRGAFHAGTRYGPKGCAMPELGHEDFWMTDSYKDKREAIGAAKADTSWVLQGCNGKAAAKELLKNASTPGDEAARPLRGRGRHIDR